MGVVVVNTKLLSVYRLCDRRRKQRFVISRSFQMKNVYKLLLHYNHSTTLDFVWDYPISQYQNGKTSLDLLKHKIVSGNGISWAICKSAPRPRQITTPASHHSVFTGQMPFVPPIQQHQSTEECR